jgi:hypothetical protein
MYRLSGELVAPRGVHDVMPKAACSSKPLVVNTTRSGQIEGQSTAQSMS